MGKFLVVNFVKGVNSEKYGYDGGNAWHLAQTTSIRKAILAYTGLR